MSLESIINSIQELDLTKKDLREIIQVATEKKRNAPNKTGTSTRKKKDPNAPKRGKTSFMYWCADYREKHQDEGKFSAKVLGPIWKEMDDEEKEPFVELATADNERYKSEMEAYKSESDGSDAEQLSDTDTGAGVGLEDDAPDFEDEDHPLLNETQDVGGLDTGDEEEQEQDEDHPLLNGSDVGGLDIDDLEEEEQEEELEEELVEPIEPVKNKSAYKHFKEIYISEHHDRKYKDKELKSIWKGLEDKSEYEEMAKADKRRYKTQMKDYEIAKKKYEKAKLKIEEGAETDDLSDDDF